MRKNEIKGIINDLLDLRSWRNPVSRVWVKEKVVFNLLSGEGNVLEEDSIVELLRERRNWFLERVKSLSGDIKDFGEATFEIYGAKEKVKIVYKGESFEGDVVHG